MPTSIPKLDCGICTLRELTIDDAHSIAKHANDIDVWRNLFDGFPHPYTMEHAKAWCGHESQSGEFGFIWGITINGEATGCIGIRPPIAPNAEVGYWLGKAHWGNGIAVAALKAVTQWAWANLPEVQRIYAPIYARNPSSQRVAEKAGFLLEARIPRSILKAGEVIDAVQYATYRQP